LAASARKTDSEPVAPTTHQAIPPAAMAAMAMAALGPRRFLAGTAAGLFPPVRRAFFRPDFRPDFRCANCVSSARRNIFRRRPTGAGHTGKTAGALPRGDQQTLIEGRNRFHAPKRFML
jgi:hypothetical protein